MKLFICIAIVLTGFAVNAQLTALPEISVQLKDTLQTAQFGPMLITTKSFDFLSGEKKACDTFAASIQITDPVKPWPPIWFATTTAGFYQNAQMKENGDIAFYEYLHDYDAGKLMNNRFEGKYKILKNYHVYDSITSKTVSLDPHDFSINTANERLLLIYLDTILNISAITGRMADTAVLSSVGLIEIWDSTGKILFYWNPLEKMNVAERVPDYIQFGQLGFTPQEFDWNHANSISWAADGNILYSFRNLGVGKINRATGEIMWRLGGIKPDISLPDSIACFGQHSFYQIKSGPYKQMYAVFSNGNKNHQAAGYIYAIDEKNKTAKQIHKLLVDGSNFSSAAGNYTVVNHTQLLSYGILPGFAKDKPGRVAFARIADSSDITFSVYEMPTRTYVYRTQALSQFSNWKNFLPARPQIYLKDKALIARPANRGEICWYEISDGTCHEAGKGVALTITKPGIFVVTEKLDFGYSVSEPFILNKI